MQINLRSKNSKPAGGGKTARKEVQKMNNSDYLTETEKFFFGYIEHIPSEYPPYEEEWNEEEITEIETLNEIFNL